MQSMKTIDAGPLHLEFLYPRVSGWDSERARTAKRRHANEARKELNDRWSNIRLACLMAVNFSPGDDLLILTFDDAHLPPNMAGVLRALRSWHDRLKRAREKSGKTLRMVFRVEHLHGDGRWHIHVLLNRAGDLTEIKRYWKYGLVFRKSFHMNKTENAMSLAAYFTKERTDRVGQKRWGKRGVLRGADMQTWTVEDSAELRLPPGARKLEDGGRSNEYGKYQFLFYMDAGAARRRSKPPARGRKRTKKSARPAV